MPHYFFKPLRNETKNPSVKGSGANSSNFHCKNIFSRFPRDAILNGKIPGRVRTLSAIFFDSCSVIFQEQNSFDDLLFLFSLT